MPLRALAQVVDRDVKHGHDNSERLADLGLTAALRASGDGWQTRINETLRASLRLADRI